MDRKVAGVQSAYTELRLGEIRHRQKVLFVTDIATVDLFILP